MANSTDQAWDETSPTNSDALSVGAQETRLLRAAVADRMDKEHKALATAGVGGEHREGAGRVYHAATAPTKKPDGVDNLDSDDEGRVWVDSTNENLQTHDGTSWNDIQIKKANIEADAVDGTKIADNAVDTEHIAEDAVDSDEIAEGAIDPAHLAAAAVETAKILDANVTLAKLADAVVTRFTSVKVGSYTGGGAGETTVAVGFTPTAIFILPGAEAKYGSLLCCSFAAFAGVNHAKLVYMANNPPTILDNAIEFTATGFKTKRNNEVYNESGMTYYYVAFKSNTA